MHEVVKEIISRHISNDDKINLLNILMDDIVNAKHILSGEYKYCPKCEDYYLTKSFQTETETKFENVCTYEDPINSGGNEYTEKVVGYVYSICPKGHKEIINKIERSTS